MGAQIRSPLRTHYFDTVHKRLPQLKEVEEVYGHIEAPLNELPVSKANNLMHMYMKRGNMMYARHVFDTMPKRDVVSWNIMIFGYAKQEQGARALDLFAWMHSQGVQPSDRTFVAILKACSSLAVQEGRKQVPKIQYLAKGRAIHFEIVKNGFESDRFVGNTLLNTYAKCGSMEDALRVFDGLPECDILVWNSIILASAEQENSEFALELFARMHQENLQPNDITFVGALKACCSLVDKKQANPKFMKVGCLAKGRAIHSQVVKNGFEPDAFIGNNLVNMYVKCGSMEDARHIFDQLPRHDVFRWTTMILGYNEHDDCVWALELFGRMHKEGVQPNDRTFVVALKACSSLAAQEDERQVDEKFTESEHLEKGRTIHCQILTSGFESDVFVGTSLVNMYANCGSMEDAWRVFENLHSRDVVTWNSMILGYADRDDCALALELYVQMHQQGVQPNDRTFVGALKAFSSLVVLEKQGGRELLKLGCKEKGKAIHSQLLTKGFESDTFVGNALINMYAKCGSMDDAQCIFNRLPHRNVVTWSTMILEYAEQEQSALALDLYARMHQEGVKPNCRTFVGTLKACSSQAALEDGKRFDMKSTKKGYLMKGRAIHAEVLKTRLESDEFVGTTLVNMYVRCGSIQDARSVFDELPYRNVVAWNTMMLGYADQDESDEAFTLYVRMQEQGLSSSSGTFVAILKACGNIAALEIGIELYSQACRVGFDSIVIVATSLIDMFARCGCMGDAQKLFDLFPTGDLVPWSALIAGYARLGRSELVFQLFETMRYQGIQPDGITFLSLLNVCSHVGLVKKGQNYFQAMIKQHGMVPTIEHYTCMVDLLGRAGQIEEALTMVEKMPFQPDLVIWSTVLGACRQWKNVEVGRNAFQNAVNLDNTFSAPYILMAHIYADSNMQEDCFMIHKMRNDVASNMQRGLFYDP